MLVLHTLPARSYKTLNSFSWKDSTWFFVTSLLKRFNVESSIKHLFHKDHASNSLPIRPLF